MSILCNMFRFSGTEDKIKNISLENPKGKEYNKKREHLQ